MGFSPLSEIVTFNPEFVSEGTRLDRVATELAQAGTQVWFVVDGDHRPFGLLTALDVIRAMEHELAAPALVSATPGPAPFGGKMVGECLSRPLISVSQSDSPKKSLRTLVDNGLLSLPVTEQGRLVAVLSATDFLREFSYGSFHAGRDSVVEHLVKDLPVIEVATPLGQAEQVFAQEQSKYLCVVDEDFPVGVVSLAEVQGRNCQHRARFLMSPGDSDAAPAAEATLAELVHGAPIIQPGRALFEAAATMFQAHMRAVTVVNRACRWLGAITTDSILRTMLYDQLSE